MKRLSKKRIPSTLLALVLDGSRLEGAVVRRTNGSMKVLQTVSAPLALNPLNSDPELFGRELRNNLDQAGIKERNCVFCVPLSWALVMQAKVPELQGEDLQNFLQIEVERGFPYAPETLLTVSSICATPGAEKLATLAAVPRNHLLQFEKALRAAQLKPLGFTLAITSLHSAELDVNRGALSISVGENTVDLQITINGGVAILRSLDGAIEVEGSQRSIDADALAREIRVTLGQLPMELRGSIRMALFFGSNEMAQRLVAQLRPKLEKMGMAVETVSVYASNAFRSQYPPNTNVSPVLSAAARFLTNSPRPFELLPPKVSAWQQLTARISSRKLGWAAAAAAIVVLAAGGAIGYQEWELSKLRSEWSGMQAKARELEDMQTNIRMFRPWFDETQPSLSIMRRLTEAFPAEGSVWMKSVEIRNQSAVTCSGTAKNSPALTRILNELHASMDSMRGNSPAIQFTFNFQWSPERNEN